METGNEHISIDITRLRMERRPLWMTPLGISSFAEMLGDGGDLYTDRLTPDFPRFNGQELMGDEEEEAKRCEGKLSEMEGFPPGSELTNTVEEAFRSVCFPEETEKILVL